MLDGWDVREVILPDGVRGQCDWALRTIFVRPDLTWPQLRVTLVHERWHAVRGPFPRWMEAREERTVNQLTARELIPLCLLGDALAWTPWLEEAADELDVTPALLRTRLKHLHPTEKAWLTRRLEWIHD